MFQCCFLAAVMEAAVALEEEEEEPGRLDSARNHITMRVAWQSMKACSSPKISSYSNFPYTTNKGNKLCVHNQSIPRINSDG